MKILNNLNYFFVGMPIALGLLGFVENYLWFWGLISTILTGVFQVIAGVCLIFIEPKNRYLQIYFGGVFFFFGLWIYRSHHVGQIAYELMFDKITAPILIGIPPILAIYLSVIIFNKAKN